MCPKVPQTPVEALVHLGPPCRALGSKTTLLIQVRALLELREFPTSGMKPLQLLSVTKSWAALRECFPLANSSTVEAISD